MVNSGRKALATNENVMKSMLLATAALLVALSGYTQGTVQFSNRNTAGTSHVYGVSATRHCVGLRGNSPVGDIPAGLMDYAAAGMTPLAGPHFLAQLLGANGADQPELNLVPQSATTTFRTGNGAGYLAVITATLAGIPKDSPVATLQVVAWDNSSGLYPTWEYARWAWLSGMIVAGSSAPFNVFNIGGDTNTPPPLPVRSFNLYYPDACPPEIKSIPQPERCS